MFKQKKPKPTMISPNESIKSLDVKIKEISKELSYKLFDEHANSDDLTQYYLDYKIKLTRLLLEKANALIKYGNFLRACANYYSSIELTGSYFARTQLRFDIQQTRSAIGENGIDITCEISPMNALEYFLHGLQALSGIGLEHPNEKLAFLYFNKGAEMADKTTTTLASARCCYMLGRLYAEGRGVKQDYSQAIAHYDKAYYPHLYNHNWRVSLGRMHEHGYGVPQDYSKAVKLYHNGAAYDFPCALTNLGMMYVKGHGINQDYKKAVACFQKAAYQEYPEAQYRLAWMYIHGRGVDQNYNKAIGLFNEAAHQGYADAQFQLGVMFAVRWMVDQDNEQAHLWFETYINNIGLSQIRKAEKKIITDFFNRLLKKTSCFSESYMDCLIRAKSLELQVGENNTQAIFIIYQLLKSLDYNKLRASLKGMGEAINNQFRQEDYVNQLISFCSLPKQSSTPFLFKASIKKNDQRYQLTIKVLSYLATHSNDMERVNHHFINIDNLEPAKLISTFSNVLSYLKPYLKKNEFDVSLIPLRQ